MLQEAYTQVRNGSSLVTGWEVTKTEMDFSVQIKLYRNYLSNSSANGLWQHIVLGSSGNDRGHWSTGKLPRNPQVVI